MSCCVYVSLWTCFLFFFSTVNNLPFYHLPSHPLLMVTATEKHEDSNYGKHRGSLVSFWPLQGSARPPPMHSEMHPPLQHQERGLTQGPVRLTTARWTGLHLGQILPEPYAEPLCVTACVTVPICADPVQTIMT